MSYETIIVRQEVAIAAVERNRPEALNAVTVQFAQELRREPQSIAADRNVGSVGVGGVGRAFSAEFDLKDGGAPLLNSGRSDTGWELRNAFHPVVLALREMPQPVVAAVNGLAAGTGRSYALACDIVVAARFGVLSPCFPQRRADSGWSDSGCASAPGVGVALEMALLSEQAPAVDADARGIVNQLAEDDDLVPTGDSGRRTADGSATSAAG